MLTYFQAQRAASRNGVPEEIIEKDFFIELILFYLIRNNFFKEKIIFRGGTALKKIYFPEYRFSEDLDFLIEERENLLDYQHNWNQILKKINSEYPFQLNARGEAGNDRLQFFINYNIIPEIRTVKELKIDILKDSIIPAFTAKRILWAYQEFNQERDRLNSYILESIASDKICRILDVDNEPRDIYDLWYMMKLKLNIPKIKEQVKNRLGYEISYPNLLNEIMKEDLRINWRLQLEKQIGDLPSYDIVTEELKKSIEAKLLST